jgi:predicted PurR-regulated permease PerM
VGSKCTFVTPPRPLGGALPAWLRATVAYCLAALVVALAATVALRVLLSVRVVTFAVVAALLLAALIWPLTSVLVRRRVPPSLSALVGVLLVLGVPVGVGFLLVSRAFDQFGQLQVAVTRAIDDLRRFLVDEPFALQPERVDELRDSVVRFVQRTVPDPVTGATLALEALSGTAIAVFVLFFLLKDGGRMRSWLLSWTPVAHRDRVDSAGGCAWETLQSYVQGTVVIAIVDAVGIGLALVVLDVPLVLSLTLLVFLGAFVPILGATLSGALAVVVTLVAQGVPSALILLAVVLVVQQLEGNVLQPLVMGRALRLHPVVILLAVSAGGLLAGVAGAIVAVPVVAVTYRVADHLAARGERPGVAPAPAEVAT